MYGSVNGNVHGKGKIEIKKDGSGERRFDDGANHHRRRSILQGLDRDRVDRDREERGKGRRRKPVLADGICTGYAGGGRGAEEYLITKGESSSL